MDHKQGSRLFLSVKRGFIPILMFSASFVFFFITRHAQKDQDLLQRSGIIIEGTVIEKRIGKSEDYGDKYHLKYGYVYKDNEYTKENRVYEELYTRKEINDTIPVRILPEDPKVSVIHSTLVFPKSEDLLVLTIILFLTGLMFVIIRNYKSIEAYLKKKLGFTDHQ
jgi:hypothetical protein